MARGKRTRRLSSSSAVHPNLPSKPALSISSPTCTTTCKTCASNGFLQCSGQCLLNPASFGHKSAQDVQEAIDYHWKILPSSIREFILADPNSLSLQRFVSFYSMPEHIDNTSRNVAASICGCSWYLALHYMFLGKFAEAKGLILNAAFLQEVYNVSISSSFVIIVLALLLYLFDHVIILAVPTETTFQFLHILEQRSVRNRQAV
jgi:hypothetical protein